MQAERRYSPRARYKAVDLLMCVRAAAQLGGSWVEGYEARCLEYHSVVTCTALIFRQTSVPRERKASLVHFVLYCPLGRHGAVLHIM